MSDIFSNIWNNIKAQVINAREGFPISPNQAQAIDVYGGFNPSLYDASNVNEASAYYFTLPSLQKIEGNLSPPGTYSAPPSQSQIESTLISNPFAAPEQTFSSAAKTIENYLPSFPSFPSLPSLPSLSDFINALKNYFETSKMGGILVLVILILIVLLVVK